MSEALAEELFAPDKIAELRQQVQNIIHETGKPVAHYARESGIPNGTFSAWVADKYQGRNDRIAAEVQRWLESRTVRAATQSRLPKAPEFVLTPSAEAYFAVFQHAQFAPDFGMITGSPGVGKTTATDAYTERNPHTWKLTAEPCFGSVTSLLDAVGEVLDINGLASRRLSRAIVKKLRGTTGLLIVDEAQHLDTKALDQLRMIHDLAGIGIVLVGNDNVYTLIEGGSRTVAYAQLFSRVGMRLPRPKPVQGDITALLDAWDVTTAPERRLLTTIARKPGALRTMTKVLRQARLVAGLDQTETMTVEHIRQAYQRLSSNVLVEEAA